MGVFADIACTSCGQTKTEFSDGSFATVCADCRAKEEDAARRKRLDALRRLSLNERLARIEEWIDRHGHPAPDALF